MEEFSLIDDHMFSWGAGGKAQFNQYKSNPNLDIYTDVSPYKETAVILRGKE